MIHYQMKNSLFSTVRLSTTFHDTKTICSAHKKNKLLTAQLYNKCNRKQYTSDVCKKKNACIKKHKPISFLDEIFNLKNTRATSVVIENKLKALCFYYKNHLEIEGKEEFLEDLVIKYSVDHDMVRTVSKQLVQLRTDDKLLLKTEEELERLLTPQYMWLFTHLGRLNNGIKFLVDLRCDILNLLSRMNGNSRLQPALLQLDSTLKELLSLWFSGGSLHLQKVSWSSASSLVEKVSKYEAVHRVHNWKDIKNRLGPYCRCMVYTHDSLPGEPLVILHIALASEISNSIERILQKKQMFDELENKMVFKEDSENVKAFIFYSISATQRGLQGIELGNHLIKGAANEMQLEFPQVTMFSSLSPIPSFRQWLIGKIDGIINGDNMLLATEWDEVLESLGAESTKNAWSKLKSKLLNNSWIHDEHLVKTLKTPLMVSCSRYLYSEKKRGYAFDSVANFHLRNGAVMWRLNWLADRSAQGLSNSCGLMVNYRYYLDDADHNSLKYVQGGHIFASEQFLKLIGKYK